MNSLIFCIALTVTIGLASIIEWLVHKYPMHHRLFRRFPPFKRHAIAHHQERQAPGKFFAKPGESRDYHPFQTSFMPVLWLLHMPLFWLVYQLLGWWPCLGVALGTATYVAAYEVLHWAIHYPDSFWFSKHAWFSWLTEHHRRHHAYPKSNFNVVLPFADCLLGTLTFRSPPPEPEQEARSDDHATLMPISLN